MGLAQELRKVDRDETVSVSLSTSQRVLRRVTDGIYRRPAAAIRELISNAYDADATRVVITTDAPRFEKIEISDNGAGFSVDTLEHMVNNIGGSLKRIRRGANERYHVTSESDPTRSPGGRKLIGKIGIGLFAVSQLTKQFRIITKQKGDDYRTVADVDLITYAEEEIYEQESEILTGTASVWTTAASDVENHGTVVILRNLLPNSRRELQSARMWSRTIPLEPGVDGEYDRDRIREMNAPTYHVGRIGLDGETLVEPPVLPWNDQDSPIGKFRALVNTVFDSRFYHHKPSVAKFFDEYLQMIWNTALAAPVDYLEKHPFDVTADDGFDCYMFEPKRGGQATKLKLPKGKTVRDVVGLVSPQRDPGDRFVIEFDGLELRKPVRLFDLPGLASNRQKRPMLFVGKARSDLATVPEEYRGGPVGFESYWIWNSRTVPLEHAGLLIRVHDATGLSYDKDFLDYPIAEYRRKTQVSAEILVTEGVEAALNIDRETLNVSHPHMRFLSNWVHNAFLQLANTQKDVARRLREVDREREAKALANEAEQLRAKQLERHLRDAPAMSENPPPKVLFTEQGREANASEQDGSITYSNDVVFGAVQERVAESLTRPVKTNYQRKVESLVAVFDAYNLLDVLDFEQQERLFAAIIDIFYET